MSAPVLWIIFPALVAGVLLAIRDRQKLTILLGVLITGLLAVVAWFRPIGSTYEIGSFSFTITETLTVLGRRFILSKTDAPILILIYLGAGFWFGGAYIARTNRLFVPIGMGIASLLTAALAVEPFLYAALIIELVVLLAIPMLTPPGHSVGKGVLRFLTFQTLGMPFILFTGWMLSGVEASPGDSELVLQASVLIAFGFVFLLAIFPFHSWIPMIAEETHPYIAAYLFYIFPLSVLLFGLGFLDRYAWLRSSPDLLPLLGYAGGIMVLFAGIWSAFGHNLSRMLGYAAIFEIGLSLISIRTGLGLENAIPNLDEFFSLILPRALSLAVWALALMIIRNKKVATQGSLDYHTVQGVGRSLPIAAGALVISHFSLAGFPLLAGFPARLSLSIHLVEQDLTIAMIALVGSAGLMIGAIRSLAALTIGSPEETSTVGERRGESVLLLIGSLAVVIVGIFPQWFLPLLSNMGGIFPQLSP